MTAKQITDLSKVDFYLLRSILGVHSKVPIVFLYMETASMQIADIISCRRMIYLQTVLKREQTELTRRVYDAMKTDKSPNSWYGMVTRDFDKIVYTLNEAEIINMTEGNYKAVIKRKVRKYVFNKLCDKKLSMKKICNLIYTDLDKPQKYLTDPSVSDDIRRLVVNLRSRCVRGIKDNLHGQFQSCSNTPYIQVTH